VHFLSMFTICFCMRSDRILVFYDARAHLLCLFPYRIVNYEDIDEHIIWSFHIGYKYNILK
jgi:hypothetical protein